MTPDQIIAFNAGRRLLKRGKIGHQAQLFDLDQHHGLLRPRELVCATRLGDPEFEHWARQGALHQFTRLIASHYR